MNHDKHIFVRLTTADLERLDALAARISLATRSAIAREAMRIGLSAIENDPAVLLAAPLPKRGGARQRKAPDDASDDVAAVVEAARTALDGSNMGALVFVAPIVRGLAKQMNTGRAHAALLEADRRGLLELRPESGLGRLSKADVALCPRGSDGTPLSVVRVIEADKSTPAKRGRARR